MTHNHKNILITGASGNIGFEVVRFLMKSKVKHKVIAAVRNLEKAKETFKEFPELRFRRFDFEDPKTFTSALDQIDRLFLLRPPHISNVNKYFRPLIKSCVKPGTKEIVFLSVQGAEKSNIIPHRKIENLIMDHTLNYVFLRPGYFMQNLTTTLLDDIKTKKKIILPAGKAKFNWIDGRDIGEAAAMVLQNFSLFKKQACDLTGYENLNFYSVTDLIRQTTGTSVQYKNVNPLRFYLIKKKEGMPAGKIMVMMMLHLLPRFQKEPEISGFYEKLTGKKPGSLKAFLKRELQKHLQD